MSVYDDGSWNAYGKYNVAAASSGCLEIDELGRYNLIYFAGEKTGLTYEDGHYRATCSGVKAVCTENILRFHSFPSDFQPESKLCENCQEPVPLDPRTYVEKPTSIVITDFDDL